jgi:hypothetical protein
MSRLTLKTIPQKLNFLSIKRQNCIQVSKFISCQKILSQNAAPMVQKTGKILWEN